MTFLKLPVILLVFFALALNGYSQISYQSLYNSSTFNNRNITLKPVGSTPGAASVSTTGAANYTIPIWCPPGTNGMTPQVALTYSSQAGNGLLGMGWGISGLSAITRVNKDIFHDGKIDVIEFGDYDKFALDGVRLVLKNGNYGTSYSEYAPEVEDFSHITYYKSGSMDYFSVRKKDGMLYEYGNIDNVNDDACLRTGSGTTSVIVWNLRRVTDPNGNSIEYSYFTSEPWRRQAIYEIRYTRNDAQGLYPYYKIQFNTTAGRVDESNIFLKGIAVNTGLILESVVVEDEYDNPIRTYQLRYGHDGINSYLKDVTEINAEQEELNAIQFQYGSIPFALSDVLASNLYCPYATGETFCADFDGDGIDEVVNLGYNKDFQVYKRTVPLTDGYTLAHEMNSGVGGTSVGDGIYITNPNPHGAATDKSDINGDGLADLLRINITNNTVGNIQFILGHKDYVLNQGAGGLILNTISTTPVWNGTNFGSCTIAPNDYTPYVIGDFDGDKRSDIVIIYKSGSNFYPCIYSYGQNQTHILGIDFSSIGNQFEVKAADFDGDGTSELIILNNNGDFVYRLDKHSVGYYNAGLFFYSGVNKTGGSNFPSKFGDVYLGDFNGDGKTDVFGKDNIGNWKIGISNGVSWVFSNFSFLYNPNNPPIVDQVLVGDFNGDGKSDIFHAGYNTSNVGKRCVYYSKGNSFYLEEITGNWVGESMSLGDVNGDGRMDVLSKYSTSIWSRSFSIFSFRKNGTENLMEKAADGFGNVISFDYRPLTSGIHYTKGTSSTYPLMDIQFPLYAVKSMQQPDGIGSVVQTDYSYSDAIFHQQGRGFLGFKKLTKQTPLFNLKTENYLDIDPVYFIPFIKQSKSYNTAPVQQVSSVVNNISFAQGSALGAFYQKLNNSTSQDLLSGATTTTTNTYDNTDFGTIISSITDINGIETINTATTYIQPGYTTIPCMPDEVTVTRTRTGQPSATDKTKFIYDGQGRLYQKYDRYQTPFSVLTTLQYNEFGNLTNESKVNLITAGVNPGTISSSCQYDLQGRFVESTTNPLGQTSYTTWHSIWGKLLTNTGIDGIVTAYTYDDWGKLTSTKIKSGLPEEETITYSDGWDINGNQLYYTLASQPTKPDIKTWYDKLGRTIRTQTEQLNGLWTESTKSYDIKGNVLTETLPRLTSEPTFTTTYQHNDFLNRLTSATNSFGTTSYSYTFIGSGNSKETITDPGGRPTSTTTDATGKIIETVDAGGTLKYEYDSRGNLLATKLGTTTLSSHSYNSIGIKTTTYDISSGQTTYSYDAFGRLKSEKDANNHTHTFRYNELGLITQRSGPEGTTYYSYHGAGSGLSNQIATIAGFNGTNENFYYDHLGRLNFKDKTIDGHTYSTAYTYDNSDHLTKKEYSDGFYLNYNYNNGFLISVVQPIQHAQSVPDPAIFSSPVINGLGQYTQYKLRNGLTTTNTYNQGYLTRTTTPGVQDLEMTYNYTTGNLTRRDEHTKSLKEHFSYDNLDRLTQSTVEKYSSPQSIATPLTVGYDLNGLGQTRGNIISKTDVGSFATGMQARTHSTPNENSLISQQTQDVTYTAYRKTATVKEIEATSGNEYIQSFTYDAGYDRAKTEVTENSAPILTRHYLDDYEVNIDPNTQNKTFIHYIAGGDGLCAIAEVQDQFYALSNNVTYHVVYKDHLGSLVAATDVGGAIEAEQNFDAWGRERNPTDWTYNNVSGVGLTHSWLYRGYTGHENMPHFSIINMNGRMYDPVLGRMMSPDIYLHSGTQGLNRYSYASNNPLKYTDPSGDIPVNVVSGIVGAVIGGGLNVALHWKDINEGGKFNWGKAGMAFGIGAAGGFVAGFTFGAAGGAAGATSAFSMASNYAVAASYSYMVSQPITAYGNHAAFGDPIPTEKEYVIGLATNVALSWTGGLIQGKLSGLPWTNPVPRIKEYIAPIPTREVQEIGNDVSNASYKPGSSAAIKSTNLDDVNHSFPRMVENYVSGAEKYSILGNDGVQRTLYKVDGSYRGVNGVFEWIVENGLVTHRTFIPSGTATNPFPNQWVQPSIKMPKW
ncbi:MAG TPA: FG-GAP-like repeat-containing protein [Flavipsychrobacter sp.]|nr:FG-GAP-like repeat-containing protein [Flavipsychrobacter sp.]